jgi:hypothetical protein
MRLVALALLVPFAPTAHADCMRVELTPKILTTRDTHLPADGGVLVGYANTTGDPEPTGKDPSDATKWTASTDKKTVALTHTLLAPGLSVYKPPADVGSFTIASSKGDKLGSFTHDTKSGASTAMPAPKPLTLTVTSTAGFRHITSTSAVLLLDAAPPPEAVAVIVYRVVNGKAAAISFATLADTHDKDTTLDVYHSGGHCSPGAPGSAPSGEVAFAFVDAFGHLSPQSKTIAAKTN